MTLQFQAGTSGRAANLGYRFYKADGTYSGARVTASISEIASTGNYVADSVTIPSDAVGVYWNDDTLTTINAIETLIDPAKFSLNDGSVNSDSVASTALVNVTAWTVALTGNITGNLSGSVGSVTGLTASDVGAIKTKTDQLTFTIANQVDSNALSGGGGLDAAGVRAAIGLASANLDTQIATLATASNLSTVSTNVSAIKAKTDNLPAAPAAVGDIPTAIQNADTLLDRNMATGTDSGSSTVRTPRQALRALRNKFAVVATSATAGTYKVAKEDDDLGSPSWESTVTLAAGASPVTESDPAGP